MPCKLMTLGLLYLLHPIANPLADYFETFSPMVKPTTIQIVLTLAMSKNWPVKQLDVHNAFLHSDLGEDVFMVQPPGFVDSNNPSYVCKLQKALMFGANMLIVLIYVDDMHTAHRN
ncbi:Retrovirus-related Pol polyprotein from transposon RE1 [Vitis vinifera]|uniref:Retrovirus-related Pol polyprotein from transposon RE1 n=1 Tax=Vitis vinifera TaxID=29760 RepID=A0A438GBW5_VITVI|nr:Retrovirus-related Pol polyprotein from transposon RE1 [Vitis vinifera]